MTSQFTKRFVLQWSLFSKGGECFQLPMRWNSFPLIIIWLCYHFRTPESVLCCILPGNSNNADISIRIQHTLIEAYCWENEIEVIKLSSNEELRSLVKESSLDGKDLNCILICDKEVSSDYETDYTDLESEDESYDWPSWSEQFNSSRIYKWFVFNNIVFYCYRC